MPELEVTSENAAEIAEKEFKEEKKAKEEGTALPEKKPLEDEETSEEGKETKKAEEVVEEGKKEEQKEKEEGKEEEAKSDEELLKAPDEELSEEELKQKQDLTAIRKEEDEKVILEKEEKDLSEEEKTRKADILKVKEDAFNEEVKEYAKENDIPEDVSRKRLESVDKVISEKFKGNTRNLAKSYLHLQSVFDKTAQEYKTLKDAPAQTPLTIENVMKAIDAGKITFAGKPADRATVLEVYREENPETAEMTDEIVIKLAAKEYMSKIQQVNETSRIQFSANAKEKRGQLLSSLKDVDSKFVSDIEATVGKMSDYQIMAVRDLGDTVMWAKGRHYDEDVATALKEGENKGFKRGQAAKRIKTGPIGTGGAPASKVGTVTLTPAQKTEAWEMFPGAENDEVCFKLFAEVHEHKTKLQAKHKEKEK